MNFPLDIYGAYEKRLSKREAIRIIGRLEGPADEEEWSSSENELFIKMPPEEQIKILRFELEQLRMKYKQLFEEFEEFRLYAREEIESLRREMEEKIEQLRAEMLARIEELRRQLKEQNGEE